MTPDTSSHTRSGGSSVPRPADEGSRRFRQACAEMDRMLRAGETFPTEEWVSDTGPLSGDTDLAVELIFTEYVTRETLGQTPNPDDYYRRFPPFAERLRRLFGVDELLREASTDAAPPPELGSPRLPEQIGPYVPREVLGVGGAGVVYRAFDPALRREVAIKVLRAGDAAAPAEHARFRKEAGAVARLNHPNVVQVYEVDEHDGRPFLVMEYVPGGTLRTLIAERRLAPLEAAELVETLARAVHHAHDRGVIHRDLKPANVLMANGSAACGVATPQAAKITDFGLAAHFSPDAAHTATGQLIGTASYMAPEQAEAKPGWVTPAVDVYALGAILYELLVGRPPFLADNPLDTLRLVIGDDPVPPRQIQPTVPRDLETVCLACLRKNPQRRYATAEALADDLRRVIEHRPIAARPVGWAERAWKAVRRRPAAAAAAAVATVAVVGLVVGEMLFAAQLKTERDAKELQRDAAVSGQRAAEERKAEADAQRDRAEELVRKSAELRYATQLLRVSLVAETDPTAAAAYLRDPDFCPEPMREFAWHALDARTRTHRHAFPGHTRPATALVATDDGTLAVTVSVDRSVRGWNPARGKERFTIPDAHPARITGVGLSADGSVMATAVGRGVTIWTTAGDKPVRKVALTELPADAAAVTVSRDGARVAAAVGPDVVVWDAGGKELARLAADNRSPARAVAFSPDGADLAVGHQTAAKAAACRVWDWERQTVRHELPGHAATVSGLAYSRDGRVLVTATCGGLMQDAVRVWDARTGRLANTMPSRYGVWAVDAGADGTRVAAAGADGTLTVWDAVFGKPRAAFRATRPTFNPTLTLQHRDTAPASNPHLTAADVECSLGGVAFVGTGSELVTADAGGAVQVWATGPDRDRRTFTVAGGPVGVVAVAPDGKSLFVAGADGSVNRMTADGTRTRLFAFDAEPTRLVVSPDGGRFAACIPIIGPNRGTVAGDLEVRDAAGKKLFRVRADDKFTFVCEFSPDGRYVVTGGRAGAVRVWAADTGAKVAEVVMSGDKGEPAMITGVAFRPGGREVVFAARKAVHTWRFADGAAPVARETFEAHVAELVAAPGGRRVGGVLGTLYPTTRPREFFVLNLDADRPAVKFFGPPGYPHGLAFTPDGRTLAVGYSDRKVRLLHPATGQELLVLDAGDVRPLGLWFWNGGRSLVTHGRIDRAHALVAWDTAGP